MLTSRKKFMTLFAALMLLPATGAFAKKEGKPEARHEHGKTEKEDQKDGPKDGCCKECEAKTATIVRHKVKDYDAWRKEFDAGQEMREKGGVRKARVFQLPADKNDVTVIARFADEEAAKKFFASPELKTAMEKAGVVGEPQITYLTDVSGPGMCPRHGDGPKDGKECKRKDGDKKECSRKKDGKDDDKDDLEEAAEKLKK